MWDLRVDMCGSIYCYGEIVDAAQVCVGGLQGSLFPPKCVLQIEWCECWKRRDMVESDHVCGERYSNMMLILKKLFLQ